MQILRNQKTLASRAIVGITLAAAMLTGACVEVGIPAGGDKPHGELNPIQGMHASPSFKDQEQQKQYDAKSNTWKARGMRVPPNKTIHTAYRPYRHGADRKAAAATMTNPVPITADSLRYGELMYQTYCIVCHGKSGKGQGYVVGEDKYPTPPDLTALNARNMADAEIYHVVTMGQQRMWSYKNQLKPLERWAVVNYIRVLQRADSPEPQDLEKVKE